MASRNLSSSFELINETWATPRERTLASTIAIGDSAILTPSAINDAIHQLQDHQERVQKKTFTNWVNSYLNDGSRKKIDNLFVDIRDGVALLQLLESLSGVKLASEKTMANVQKIHHISNISTALKFLEERKIKLVNIHPSDVVEGKPSIVLGLIWTIILHFQIEENTRLLSRQDTPQTDDPTGGAEGEGPKKSTTVKKPALIEAKERMLDWVQKKMDGSGDSETTVKDFGPSWRDGVLINKMIHGIRQDLVDLDAVAVSSPRSNLESAFNIAEQHLGIPRLLDPEDIDVDKPDERSIMTYVAKFLEKYPEQDAPPQNMSSSDREAFECSKLLKWMESAGNILNMSDSEIEDAVKEYQSYESYMNDMKKHAAIFNKLKSAAESGKLSGINPDQFKDLQDRWDALQGQTSSWQEKLDTSLPGRLGELGQRLGEAERLLQECSLEAGEEGGDGSVNAAENLQQLRDSISELSAARDEIHHALRTGKYQGVTLSKPQMKNLEQRLDDLTTRSDALTKVIEHKEAKQNLLNKLEEAETKLKPWLDLLASGSVDVQSIGEEYMNFIKDGKLFNEMDDNFEILKATLDAFKVLNPESGSDSEMQDDVQMLFDNWNQMKSQMIQLQTRQAQAAEAWGTYNDLVEGLDDWFAKVENIENLPLAEQEQCFAQMAEWEKKLRTLRDRGDHLVGISNSETADEIKERLAGVDQKWSEALTKAKQSKGKSLDQARQNYKDKVEKLKKVIETGEKLLEQRIEAETVEIENHNQTLQNFSSNKQNVEGDLTEANSLAKSLFKDSTAQAIQEMLEDLRQTNERQKNVFSGLEDKQQVLSDALSLVQSIDEIVNNLTNFLEKGMEILEVTAEQAQVEELADTIQKCKAYLADIRESEQTIQRLQAEYNQLMKTGTHYLNSENLRDTVEQICERTQDIQSLIPIQKAKLEVQRAHFQFAECSDEAEIRLDAQKQQLKTSSDTDNLYNNYKEAFESDGGMIQKCTNLLKSMDVANKELVKLGETSQQSLVDSDHQRWDVLSASLSDFKTLLLDLPKQWQDYRQRSAKFQDYIAEMNEVTQKLSDETLTASEYKDLQERFQKLQGSSQHFEEEGRWLEETLDKLTSAGGEAENDIKGDTVELQKAKEQYSMLQANSQNAVQSAEVMAECHDFREKVETNVDWLNEVMTSLQEDDAAVNDLESAEDLLAKYEAVRERLRSQKSKLQSDIAEGVELMERDNVPSFINQSVNDLKSTLKNASTLSEAKYNALKEKVKTLKEFEKAKENLNLSLQKVNTEASKTSLIGSQDLVRKELKSKKDLLASIDDLHAQLTELNALKTTLGESLDEEGRQKLEIECQTLEAALAEKKMQAEEQLKNLDACDKQWSDFNQQMTEVNEKLSQALESQDGEDFVDDVNSGSSAETVEQQLAALEAEKSDLIAQGKLLDELEQSLENLGQGQRSRETVALKSKLTEMRRKWKGKMAEMECKQESLSNDLVHIQEFQESADHLKPILERLQTAAENEDVKCDNFSDLLARLAENKSLLAAMESNQDAHAALISSGDSLAHLPSIAGQVGQMEKDWDQSVKSLSKQEQQLEQIASTWREYEETQRELKQLLEEAGIDLPDSEGGSISTDLEKLSMQQKNYQAALDKAKRHKPLMDKLQKLSEKLKPFLTDAGASRLLQQEQELKEQSESIVKTTQQKCSDVSVAQDKMKQFWGKVDDLVKWVKVTDSGMKKNRDLYCDEVETVRAELEMTSREYEERSALLAQLEAQAKEILENCTDEKEKERITERLQALRDSLTSTHKNIEEKYTILSNWSKYNQVQKETKENIAALQRKMELQDLGEDDLVEIQQEIQKLRDNLIECENATIGSLPEGSKLVVKDRLSHKTLDFNKEVDSLQKSVSKADEMLTKKKEKHNEVTKLWEEFREVKVELASEVTDLENKLQNLKPTDNTLEAAQMYEQSVRQIKEKLDGLKEQNKNLKQLGQKLKLADKPKMAQVQEELNSMENMWSNTKKHVNDKLSALSSVISQWKLFESSLNEMQSAMSSVQNISNTPPVESKTELEKYLEKVQKAESDFQGKSRQLNSFLSQANRLTAELELMSEFSSDEIQTQQNDCLKQWDDTHKKLKVNKDSAKQLISQWETLERVGSEMRSILESSVQNMEQHQKTEKMESSAALKAVDKYKTDACHLANLKSNLDKVMAILQEQNSGVEISSLVDLDKSLREKFNMADSVAERIGQLIDKVGNEQSKLGRAVTELNEWINGIQARILQCDDVTGSDHDVTDRLRISKGLSKELDDTRSRVLDLNSKVEQLSASASSSDVISISKQMVGIKKRYESLTQRAKDISESHQNILKNRLSTALQDTQRWLNHAEERAVWCLTVQGDQYSVESKKEASRELQESLPAGKELMETCEKRLTVLRPVLQHETYDQCYKMHQQNERQWSALNSQLNKAMEKLSQCADTWKRFQELEGDIRLWFSETEKYLHTLSSLLPTLECKMERLNSIKTAQQRVGDKLKCMDEIKDLSTTLSKQTCNQRLVNTYQELRGKYDSINTSIKTMLGDIELYIKDHESYDKSLVKINDWIKSKEQEFPAEKTSADDKRAAHSLLEESKAIIQKNEKGQKLYDTCMKNGEKLDGSTSTDGKEIIRRELRDLSLTWNAYLDKCINLQKNSENRCKLFENFEEKLSEISKSLKDFDRKIFIDICLQNTLSDKERIFEENKAVLHDVASMKSSLDELKDFSRSLQSAGVRQKTEHSAQTYDKLAEKIKVEVDSNQSVFALHKQFMEACVDCRHLLDSMNSKLKSLQEGSTDRLSLASKVEKIQSVDRWQINIDTKLKLVEDLSKQVLGQTGPGGRAAIQGELEELKDRGQRVGRGLKEAATGLKDHKDNIDQYETLNDELMKWLRTTELSVKELETGEVEDLKLELDKINKIKETADMKREDFKSVMLRAEKFKRENQEMFNNAEQLENRYELLLKKLATMIEESSRKLSDQEAYSTSYSHCTQRLSDLERRLAQCINIDGDTSRIKEAQPKLEALLEMREESGAEVFRTIELGERLAKNISPESREIIKKQIRFLRERWERFTSDLNDTRHSSDLALARISTNEENSATFARWLGGAESNLTYSLKAKLKEKKAQLQDFKTIKEEIESHETILDSLQAQVGQADRSKVNDLSERFTSLVQRIGDVIKKLQKGVDDHKKFKILHTSTLESLGGLEAQLTVLNLESGDLMTLKARLSSVETIRSRLRGLESQIESTSAALTPVLDSTSELGHADLNSQLLQLQKERERISADVDSITNRLQAAIESWIKFDDNSASLEAWIKSATLNLRQITLKGSAAEKQEQIVELEISQKKTDLQTYSELSKIISVNTQDSRIAKQSARIKTAYKNLKINVKDELSKWASYAEMHKKFDDHYKQALEEILGLMDQLKAFNDDIQTLEGLQQAKDQLIPLEGEIKNVEPSLHSVFHEGEALLPSTGSQGRERLWGEMKQLREKWDTLNAELRSTGMKLEDLSVAALEFNKQLKDLRSMLKSYELNFQELSENQTRGSSAETSERILKLKTLLKQIATMKKPMNEVDKKVTQLSALLPPAEFRSYTEQLKSQYSELQNAIQDEIKSLMEYQANLSLYNQCSAAILTWIKPQEDHLRFCNYVTGDRQSAEIRLQHVENIEKSLPEGQDKYEAYLNAGEELVKRMTDTSKAESIRVEITDVKTRWSLLQTNLARVRERLQSCTTAMTLYETTVENITKWLKLMEDKLKDEILASNVHEKKSIVQKFANHVQDGKAGSKSLDECVEIIKTVIDTGRSDDVDDDVSKVGQVNKVGQASTQIVNTSAARAANETRLIEMSGQLSNRYKVLLEASQDVLNKCERNLTIHITYDELMSEISTWIKTQRQAFSSCSSLFTTKEDLLIMSDRVKDIADKKEEGYIKLLQATSAAERLDSATSDEGRDVLRHQCRTVNSDWSKLFEEVLTLQRELDIRLIQWRTVEEGISQSERWLNERESIIRSDLTACKTLPDKKLLLQNSQSVMDEITSYQKVIDGLVAKSQNLSQSGTENIQKKLNQLNEDYSQLSNLAKEKVNRCSTMVKDHAAYLDSVEQFRIWSKELEERINVNQNLNTDVLELSARLERLEIFDAQKKEGEERLARITSQSEKVIPNTLSEGQDAIFNEIKELKIKFSGFVNDVLKHKSELKNYLLKTQEFNELHETLKTEMKTLEQKLRNVESQPTLSAKQDQLQYLKNLHEEEQVFAGKFSDLSSRAEVLSKMSATTQSVTKVLHLSNRLQMQNWTVTELLSRWQHVVSDHQTFEELRCTFLEWQKDILSRLNACVPNKEDSFSLQGKVMRLRELKKESGEGYDKIQDVENQRDVVILSTASSGKDAINSVIVELKKNIQVMEKQIEKTIDTVDTAVEERKDFLESFAQLSAWIQAVESKVNSGEDDYNAGYAEIKTRHDKLMAISADLAKNRIPIHQLTQQAENITERSKAGEDLENVRALQTKYTTLQATVKTMLQQYGKLLEDFSKYRDSLLNAQDWLRKYGIRLQACLDLCGDFQKLDAKCQELKNIRSEIPELDSLVRDTSAKANVLSLSIKQGSQAVVHNEVLTLFQDKLEFSQNIEEKIASFESLLQKWKDLDKSCETVTDWITKCNQLLQETSSAKATIVDKKRIFDDYGSVHEKISTMEETIKELEQSADIIEQSCQDPEVLEKVQQLADNYSNLVSTSKELLKKLQKNSEDHDKLLSAFTSFDDWLTRVDVKLNLYMSTKHSKEQAQEHLEQFCEFVGLQEEGQILLHSVDVYSKKVLANTSEVGQANIEVKVKECQGQWSKFKVEMERVKEHLESSYMRWSQVTIAADQLSSWMDEVDQRRQVAPSVSLADKKAQLHRMKNLLKEVSSREHAVESLNAQLDEIDGENEIQDSGVLKLSDDYRRLIESIKAQVAEAETQVVLHEAYEESYDSLNSWIQDSKEKLLGCSEVTGDSHTIEDKLNRIKALEESLEKGEKLLEQVKSGATMILPQGGAVSSTVQDPDVLKSQLDDLRAELRAAQGEMSARKQEWVQYEGEKGVAVKWLDDMEEKLRNDQPKDTAAEKEQNYKNKLKLQEDVLAHKTILEELGRRMKTLSDGNTNSPAAVELNLLNNKYKKLVASLEQSVRKAETALEDQRNYDSSVTEYLTVVTEAQDRLSAAVYLLKHPDSLEDALTDLTNLEVTLNSLIKSRLSEVNAKGKTASKSSSPSGTANIQNTLETFNSGYNQALENVQTAKESTRQLIKDLHLYKGAMKNIGSVLDEVDEGVMKATSEKPGSLKERKTKIKSLEEYLKQAEGTKSLFESLGDISSRLPESMTSDRNFVESRWKNLTSGAEESLELLKRRLEGHEELENILKECLTQSEEIRERLTEVERDSDNADSKQRHVQDLQSKFLDLKTKTAKATALSETVAETLSPEGSNKIKSELEILRESNSQTEILIGDYETLLQNSRRSLAEYFTLKQEFQDWLSGLEKKQNKIADKIELKLVEKLISDVQDIEDAILLDTLLSSMSQKEEELSQVQEGQTVSAEILEFNDRVNTLKRNNTSLSGRLKQLRQDHGLYKDQCMELRVLLDKTYSSLQNNCQISGDVRSITSKLDALKGLSSLLDDCSRSLSSVSRALNNLSSQIPLKDKRVLDADVQQFQHEFENLTETAQNSIQKMSAWLEKRLKYDQLLEDLKNWNKSKQTEYKEIREMSGNLKERKERLKQLRKYLESLAGNQREFEKLKVLSENLDQLSTDQVVGYPHLEEVNNIGRSVEKKRNKLQSEIQELEGAVQCQELFEEKLKQFSENLNHNQTKYKRLQAVSDWTYESVQALVFNYQELLQELKSDSVLLSELKQAGNAMCEDNRNYPELISSIQNQLKNFEDSSKAMEQGSQEILKKLRDSLTDWQTYQQIVESCAQFLDTVTSSWLSGDVIGFDEENTEEILGKTKELLQRARQFTLDLQGAQERCMHRKTGITEASYSTPLAESSVSVFKQRALHVDERCHETSAKLEEVISKIVDTKNKWTDMEGLKEKLNAWLNKKSKELKEISRETVKLDVTRADRDITALNTLLSQVQDKRASLEKLTIKCAGLFPQDPEAVHGQVDGLYKAWGRLTEAIRDEQGRRREALNQVRGYEQSQRSLRARLDQVGQGLERVKREDTSGEHRVKQCQNSSGYSTSSTQTSVSVLKHLQKSCSTSNDSLIIEREILSRDSALVESKNAVCNTRELRNRTNLTAEQIDSRLIRTSSPIESKGNLVNRGTKKEDGRSAQKEETKKPKLRSSRKRQTIDEAERVVKERHCNENKSSRGDKFILQQADISQSKWQKRKPSKSRIQSSDDTEKIITRKGDRKPEIITTKKEIDRNTIEPEGNRNSKDFISLQVNEVSKPIQKSADAQEQRLTLNSIVDQNKINKTNLPSVAKPAQNMDDVFYNSLGFGDLEMRPGEKRSINIEHPVSVVFINEKGAQENVIRSSKDNTIVNTSFPSLNDTITDAYLLDNDDDVPVKVPILIDDDDDDNDNDNDNEKENERKISDMQKNDKIRKNTNDNNSKTSDRVKNEIPAKNQISVNNNTTGRNFHSMNNDINNVSDDLMDFYNDIPLLDKQMRKINLHHSSNNSFNSELDMLDSSSRPEVEVVEHQTVRLQTVLVANTGIETDTDDDLINTKKNIRRIKSVSSSSQSSSPLIPAKTSRKSDDTSSCCSGLTEPEPACAPMIVSDSSTQTPRTRRTQTNPHQDTQTDIGGLISFQNIDAFSNGEKNTTDADDFWAVENVRPIMKNFSQQTPGESSTQTPVFLRLDLANVSNTFLGCNDDVFGLAPRQERKPRDFASNLEHLSWDDIEGTERNIRNFGTQTFGQLTNEDTATAETQTILEEFPVIELEELMGEEEELINGELCEILENNVDQNEEIKTDTTESASNKSRRKSRRRRKRSKSIGSQNCSTDEEKSTKKDLIALMIKEVRDLKEQVQLKYLNQPSSMDHSTVKPQNKYPGNNEERGLEYDNSKNRSRSASYRNTTRNNDAHMSPFISMDDSALHQTGFQPSMPFQHRQPADMSQHMYNPNAHTNFGATGHNPYSQYPPYASTSGNQSHQLGSGYGQYYETIDNRQFQPQPATSNNRKYPQQEYSGSGSSVIFVPQTNTTPAVFPQFNGQQVGRLNNSLSENISGSNMPAVRFAHGDNQRESAAIPNSISIKAEPSSQLTNTRVANNQSNSATQLYPAYFLVGPNNNTGALNNDQQFYVVQQPNASHQNVSKSQFDAGRKTKKTSSRKATTTRRKRNSYTSESGVESGGLGTSLTRAEEAAMELKVLTSRLLTNTSVN